MSIKDMLPGSIQNLTNKVEAFNDIALDKSLNTFKSCLGDGFPFDVLQSVQSYAENLSSILNSSIDDLLCGTSVISGALDLIPTKQLNTLSESLSNVDSTIFNNDSEKESILKNGAMINHTISGNGFIKSYSKEDLKQNLLLESGNIGANKIAISALKTDTTASQASFRFYISVNGLKTGPNDGQTETTDANNVTPDYSGSFFLSTDFPVSLDSPSGSTLLKTEFSGNSNISLNWAVSDVTIEKTGSNPDTYQIKDYTLELNSLYYNKCWCGLSDGLTSAQNDAVKVNESNAQALRQVALNSLKGQFVTSSLLTDTIDSTVKDLKTSYPALSGINSSVITNSVKSSIASSAISVFNSESTAKLDTTFAKVLAEETVKSSVNNLLESNGIGGALGSKCTKAVLGNIAGVIPSIKVQGLTDVFNFGQADIVPFDVASLFSNDVLKKMNGLFEKVTSSECLKAINAQFDLISNDIVNAYASVEKASISGNAIKGMASALTSAANKGAAMVSGLKDNTLSMVDNAKSTIGSFTPPKLSVDFSGIKNAASNLKEAASNAKGTLTGKAKSMLSSAKTAVTSGITAAKTTAANMASMGEGIASKAGSMLSGGKK